MISMGMRGMARSCKDFFGCGWNGSLMLGFPLVWGRSLLSRDSHGCGGTTLCRWCHDFNRHGGKAALVH